MPPFRESPVHLLVVVLLPLLAGLASLVRPRGARPLPLVSIAAAVGLALLAVDLGAAGRHTTIVSHVARLVRVGSLDATLGFAAAADRLLVAAAVLVGAVVLGLGRGPRQLRLGMATTGALGCALGQGFPTVVAALGTIALAGAMGASDRTRATRAGALAFSGVTAVAFAGAVVFWMLGGQFLDGRDFFSDYQPRFVADVVGGDLESATPAAQQPGPAKAPSVAVPLRAGDRARLYVVSHPGARVYLGVANEGQLRGRVDPIAESPAFGVEIPAALHKIAIDPGGGATIGGDGAEVALVDPVRALPQSDVVLRLVGSTVTFHEIADQVGRRPEIAKRTLGGSPVAGLAAALIAIGAIAVAIAFARDDDRGVAATSVAGALSVLPAAADLTPPGAPSVVVMLSGSAVVAVLALWALRRRSTFAARSLVPALFVAAGVASAACGSTLAITALVAGTALVARSDELGVWQRSAESGVPLPIGPGGGLVLSIVTAANASFAGGVVLGVVWVGAAFVLARLEKTTTSSDETEEAAMPHVGRVVALGAVPVFVVGSVLLQGIDWSLGPLVCALGAFALGGAAAQLAFRSPPLGLAPDEAEGSPSTRGWFDRVDGVLGVSAIVGRPARSPRSGT